MKIDRQLFYWFTGLYLLLFVNVSGNAQTYSCRIKNSTQLSCNVFEFDVILQRTGSTALNLAIFQMGINVNPA